MLRRFRRWLAVGLLPFALPLPAQDTPPLLQSKVFEPMPVAEIDAIRESRRKAHNELFKDRSRYDFPPGAALCAVFSKSALYDTDGDDDDRCNAG